MAELSPAAKAYLEKRKGKTSVAAPEPVKVEESAAEAYKKRRLGGVPTTIEVPEQNIAGQLQAEELRAGRAALEGTKDMWIASRAEQLAAVGDGLQSIDQPTAIKKASAEYEELFNKPQSTSDSYGPPSALLSRPASLADAPLISNVEPIGKPSTSELIRSAIGRQRFVSDPAFVQEQQQIQSSPDWKAVEAQLSSAGVEGDNLNTEMVGLKSAYGYLRGQYPAADPADVMKQVILERNKLSSALEGKEGVIKEELQRGIEDEYYQAFSVQKKEGEVPDLSPVQMRYLNAQIKDSRAKILAESREELKAVRIPTYKLSNGKQVDQADYDPRDGQVISSSTRELTDQEALTRSTSKADRLAPDLWWTDPARKADVIANPEAYYESGLFETATPYGGTIESGAAYGLRMALSPLNAIAGALTEGAGGGLLAKAETLHGPMPEGFDLKEQRTIQREADDTIYKDSPVLYNIARNRGFGGESVGNAEILREQGIGTPTSRGIIMVGGFLADLLDPSLAVAGGLGAAAKSSVQTAKASRLARIAMGAPTRNIRGIDKALEIGGAAIGGITGAAVAPGDDAEAQLFGMLAGAALGAKAGKSNFARSNARWISEAKALDAGLGLSRGAKAGTAAFLDMATPFGLNRGGAVRDAAMAKLEIGDPRLAVASNLASEANAYKYAQGLISEGVSTGAALKERISLALAREFKGTRFADEVAKLSLGDGETVTEALARAAQASMPPNLIKYADDVYRELNALADSTYDVTKSAGAALRAKDIARNIGSILSTNPELRSAWETAKSAPGGKAVISGKGGRSPVHEYVKFIKDEGYLDSLANQFILNKATTETIAASKDMKGFDDIVQVTSNTWAPKASVKKVLDYVKNETAIGKLAKRIVDEKVPVISINTERGTEMFYDFTNHPEIADEFRKIWREAQDFERISGSRIQIRGDEAVTQLVDTGNAFTSVIVRAKDFRTAMDATIDMVARGERINEAGKVTSNILRASDVKQLPARMQATLLEPLESRSFGTQVFAEISDWIQTKAGMQPAQRNLTIAQRQFFRRTKNELETMDRGLRKEVSRFKSDEAYRASLGFKGDVKLLSMEQILGYLTVKKPVLPKKMVIGERGRQAVGLNAASQLAHTMRWTAGRYIFAQGAKESAEILSTVNPIFSDRFLSPAGLNRLNELSMETATAMIKEPERYIELYEDFLRAWHAELIKNTTELVMPELAMNINFAKLGEEIPNSLLVGSYYHVTKDRIINRALEDIFAADTSSTRAIFGEAIPVAQRKRVTDLIRDRLLRNLDTKANIKIQDIFDFMIKRRVMLHATKNIGTAPLYIGTAIDDALVGKMIDEIIANLSSTRDDFVPIVAGAKLKAQLMNDPMFIREFRQMLIQADDVAISIIHKNQFDKPMTVSGQQLKAIDQVREIERLLGVDKKGQSTRLAIGADAFDELAILSDQGGFRRIEEWFLDQAKIQIDPSTLNATYRWTTDFLKNVQELFYAGILGVRPRFHGVNMMTGPLIAYSTVGKANLGSMYKSAKTLSAGGMTDWNRVAHIDPAGRAYTYGDIYENVILGGGLRSAVSFEISQNIIQDALRILPEKDRGLFERILSPASNLTRANELMDSTFRLNVAFRALEEGRSLDEAASLARRSMFDYGNMTKFERDWIMKYTVFYTFTRQNVTNLLKNMLSAKGWKRISIGLKTERGLEQLMNAGSDYQVDERYMPEFSATRSILKSTALDEKDLVYLGPAIPSNEAISTVIGLMALKPEAYLSFLRPDLAALLDNEKIAASTWKLQPQHVWALGGPGSVRWTILEKILGGPILGKNGSQEDGAVDGFIYPLTERQEKTYKNLIRFVENPSGLGTALRDFGRTTGGTGEPGLESFGEKVLFTTGVTTPMKVRRPEDIEAENIRSLNKEVTSDIRGRVRPVDETN
jgi:hypothetical protein